MAVVDAARPDHRALDALWLFYFEEWLASDDWKGGGMHPRDADDDRRGRPA